MASTSIPLEADYVIVGGGTAGLVLACRLSEDPTKSVVVLEAGKDLTADPRVQIPAMWTTMMGSEGDWQLKTTPQSGLKDRVIRSTQGKLLGGSSAINGQAFIAPSKLVYDSWEKLGAEGWTWENVHPYHKKSYTIQLPDPATRLHLGIDSWVDIDAQGSSGPLKISFPAVVQDPLAKAWVETYKGLGHDITADPFSGRSIGGYSNMAAVDDETKTRSYAATQYGIPAKQRPGVSILTEALVCKVIFDQTTATGVIVIIDGETHTIKANKEVIISSGAFNTPKLLELSGIGNKEILDRYNIPVVVENPNVGENLQDHLMSGISFEAVDGTMTGDALVRQEPEAIQEAMKLYAEHKAGPFTIGGVQSSAFMPCLDENGDRNEKYIKDLMDPFFSGTNICDRDQAIRSIFEQPDSPTCSHFMFLCQANLHETGKSFVGQDLLPGNFVSLGIIQGIPFSRGSTHISSSNVEDKQTIDPRYFSNPLDLEIMARNLLDVVASQRAAPLSHFLKSNGRRNHPDAFITDIESAKKYLLDTATTTYHPCGTAAMLPREKGGVVDENLRVYGTKICGFVTLVSSRNIMTAVYAIAERGADIIKGVI
ncbi:glucose-methanol-choline oxidoreductase [Penicillium verhagenii]|uniref:glucose-methanol-choline oxidoreductase n=1 Tax=Penicillium verhagenii TaxID=1562060 RepID=UPI0025455D70|nr:glucose-methanol-choline oxidoreductase [Penicillium verhagenii]KAJ5930322.1 glucose-methanol-choline oxidoreductase [Penicillium verhagenii]